MSINLSELLDYKLLLLLHEQSDLNQLYSKELKELDEKVNSAKELVKINLSKLITPEKIETILQNKEITDKLGNIEYSSETKELKFNGTKISGLTKLLVLYWLVLYYNLTTREELKSLSSSFLEKSIEILKGLFTSKVILSNEDLNNELLEQIFDKAIKSNVLFGILVYSSGLSVINYGNKNVLPILFYITDALLNVGDAFGSRIYYALRRLSKAYDNVFLQFLADTVYNELFAVGYLQTPLSVLKAKLTSESE